MSFILDALRKSDAERQRAATPGLADVRYAARPARRNVWAPILALVLAANAVVLAVVYFRGDPAPPAAAPAGAVAPAPPAGGAEQATPIRPLARETEYPEALPELDVEGEFAPPAAPATAGDAAPVPAPVVMEAPEPPSATDAPGLPPAAAAAPAVPSRIVSGNELPTAGQLMATGGLNTPVLNLDLHVYSDAPAGRFVVINTRKYKEGGQLAEGPTVEAITVDGVILSNQGRRFTLSRK
jgi:general secretion pathway protein B